MLKLSFIMAFSVNFNRRTCASLEMRMAWRAWRPTHQDILTPNYQVDLLRASFRPNAVSDTKKELRDYNPTTVNLLLLRLLMFKLFGET